MTIALFCDTQVLVKNIKPDHAFYLTEKTGALFTDATDVISQTKLLLKRYEDHISTPYTWYYEALGK